MERILTDKQSSFVDEYLKDYNATQAAIRSGYSERTASTSGYKNIKKVEIQEEIEKRQEASRKLLQQRFSTDAERARAIMFDIMDSPESPPAVRLNAAKDFLDRAGFKPVDKQETTSTGDIGVKVEWVN